MIQFGVIGTGWRTEFFLRVAQARPDLFACVGVVTRDVARAQAWAAPFDVPLFDTIEGMLQRKPLYVVTSVPWHVNPALIHELADRNIPVLSETPPATSIEEMESLYVRVEQGAKIAVAEQYHLQPHHYAQLALANSGKLGTVTQAQVSVAHGYHGISLMRRLLGITYENCSIRGFKFTSPIVKSPDRNGPPPTEEWVDSEQAIATFDFGDKLGLFDFTDDQYFSYVRKQRVTVRGERGELLTDTAHYLLDHRTPIEVTFKRVRAGEDGSLEGHYLRGIQAGAEWIYENPLAPARLYDDEIAVGHAMLKMADYAAGGEAFYSLAEACQDRYLDIMMWQAINSGEEIYTLSQRWAT